MEAASNSLKTADKGESGADGSVPDDTIEEEVGAAGSFLNKAHAGAASSSFDQADKIVYNRI